jgi:hypothetical protein
MPLKKSGSNAALRSNIKTLTREIGKSPHVQSRNQVITIAEETKRRAEHQGKKKP